MELAPNHLILEVRQDFFQDVILALDGQSHQDRTLRANPARSK